MKLDRALLLFGVAGVVGLVVDVSVLYALAPWLGWYAARVVSFVAAASATWALNRRYAFSDQASAQSVVAQYFAYLFAMLGGAALNYGVYALTLHWLPLSGAAAIGVALGSLAGLSANFLSARHLIFGTNKGP